MCVAQCISYTAAAMQPCCVLHVTTQILQLESASAALVSHELLAGTVDPRCSELPVRIVCELDPEQWHSCPCYQHDWPPSAVFCESAESDSPHLPDWAQLHSCAGMPTARNAVCSLQYCWDNSSHVDVFTNKFADNAALWHCPAHVKAVCLAGHS